MPAFTWKSDFGAVTVNTDLFKVGRSPIKKQEWWWCKKNNSTWHTLWWICGVEKGKWTQSPSHAMLFVTYSRICLSRQKQKQIPLLKHRFFNISIGRRQSSNVHCQGPQRKQDMFLVEKMTRGTPSESDLWPNSPGKSSLRAFFPAKLSRVLPWILVPEAVYQHWRGRWSLLTDSLMKYLFCPLCVPGRLRTLRICGEEHTATETVRRQHTGGWTSEPRPTTIHFLQWPSRQPSVGWYLGRP